MWYQNVSGNINIKNSGDITGGIKTYTGMQSATSTIENTGNIVTSYLSGIDVNAGDMNTVINSGIITSGVAGIFVDMSAFYGGILTIVNDGKITAAYDGIGSLHTYNTKVTVTNNGDIISSGGNGIQFLGSDRLSVTNNGNITAPTLSMYGQKTYAIFGSIQGVDTILQKSGTITGNIFLGDGDDTLTATGGALIGNTEMGTGNDTVTLSGTVDVTGVPQLDGGGSLSPWTNITGPFTDTLNIENITLRGFTAASDDSTGNLTETNNTNLTQWEVINVSNAGTLKLSGDLFAKTNVGTLNIVDSSSTLDLPGSFGTTYTVNGDVTNAGLMYWENLGSTLNITGNYTGNAGNMSLGTDLGDDNSVTDKLVVDGNTLGTTTVTVRPEGTSAGAQTTEGIKVIDIAGISGATFTLASPVQAGAYEYSLFKNGVSTPTDGDWYLRSTLIPTPTEPTTPIYRPGTSNYVSAQTANAEQGFLALGTLHERMNEQQVVSTDKQTWARIYGNTESNNGDSRFNYNQHVRAAQVGQDLYNKTTTNGTNVHSGVMFDYSYSTVDFADRVREDALLDNTTGTMNGTSYGIGGYYTAINGDESYLDVVGMVSKLENKYKDSYGMKSTQDGYRLGLSVEAGKKLAELGKWKVEGQGQLAYQYTNYDNFNDDISGIDAYGANTLRGRLGVRVYRHLESTKNIQQIDNAQVYGVANVVQDFINPTDVTIGVANISEKFDKTTLEVGGGFQVPVTGTTYVYTDARYDRSISGNKEQGKLTIGFKTQF